VVEVENLRDSSNEEIESLLEITDNLNEIGDDEREVLPPPTAQICKGNEKAEIAPMNWMKRQPPFTIQDALNGQNPDFQITLPQLLDCLPRLRCKLAEQLWSSVSRVRKKQLLRAKTNTVPVVLHYTKLSVGREVVSEALLGGNENIEFLYIETWVGGFQVPEVLVDAGAILYLISFQLVDKLKLKRFLVTGLGMRHADHRLVILKNYVWVDVVVAGILVRVKAYKVAISQRYQLLLSCRWLKRVRDIEYTRSLFIEGGDQIRSKVPGGPVGQTEMKMENLDPQGFLDVEDEEAEDAIKTLLKELDHWKGTEADGLEPGN